MPRETLGYTQLEWTCPNCSTRNPGPQKACTGCGAPQPQDVKFEQAAEERLVTDQAEIARAKAGADVQCPYCGARNPASAKSCPQCGGDLSGGQARESGAVLGAHRTGPAQPVNCPSCGAQNPGSALRCSQCGAALPQAPRPGPAAAAPTAGRSRLPIILGGIAVLLLLACCFFGVILPRLTPAAELKAQVASIAWTRTVEIEQLTPVTREAWHDRIPAGAVINSCKEKLHHTQQDPAPNARKVCGTPYTVDQGNGYGEVVQDCEYQVYADWCEYTVPEWRPVDTARLSGEDLSPRWPGLQLSSGQRAGAQREDYQVTFSVDGEEYLFHTDDVALFQRCRMGSEWTIQARGRNVESITR